MIGIHWRSDLDSSTGPTPHPRAMGKRPAASILIRLDPRARGALQQQIYSGIRLGILNGVLEPGTRLPSSRALAEDLGVSRTTTLLALEQLLAEGYLATQRGSGTFVARELPDDLHHAAPSGPAPEPKHPPLSARGAALAAVPPAARRLKGPPRAFRIGTPALDLFPLRLWSQLSRRRLRAMSPAQLDYGSPHGLPVLREAIAEQVRTRGTRCTAAQVVVVGGSQRALDLICHLLLDPGDQAWLEEPGYPGARSALLAAGARIVPVKVDGDGLDVEAGARIAPGARLAFCTPSHQFPLGLPMSLPRRLALLRWASAARAWVIEDDYDGEFRYGTHPIPCLHGLDVDSRVIYVGSFSKTLFPALRLGFLIVPPDLQPAVRRVAEVQPPPLDQAVLADFIAEGHFDRHVRRMRAAYRERLEALAAASARHCPGELRLRPVRTGLHVVADLDGVDAEQVAREAAARNVEVTPLAAYFADRAGAANALVLGFAAVGPDAVRRGMERLAAAIAAVRGR
ncbi:MAG TPA: PLP-dependent aminotransferase family protein [Thermoanaerobaculia bacterium]|nr:PLP-dependent aminotransferase family protein [Thermoanaerobaculia bacterium]